MALHLRHGGIVHPWQLLFNDNAFVEKQKNNPVIGQTLATCWRIR
jgi:hypothetical protein